MARRAALTAVLVAASFVAATAGDARTTRGAGRLVVISPNYELKVVSPDRTRSRALTRPLPGIHAPLWSPDGKRIAFLHGKPGLVSHDEPVYVVRSDGSELHVVARGNSTRWSPDGRSLLLVDVHGLNVSGTSPRPPAAGRIVVVDIRTGRRRVIGRGAAPSWSANGKRVVFVRYRYTRGHGWYEDSSRLVTVRPDGSDARVLVKWTPDGQVAYWPKWSPDGRTIAAYVVDDRFGTSEFWLINARTGATRSLPSPAGSLYEWSPDGSRLAVRLGGTGNELATVDVKSGDVHLLAVVQGDWNLSDFRWSPDGKQVAFEQWNDILERGGVYVVDSTNSRPRRIAWVNWDVPDGFDWGRS